ncbi:MAG: hypothetical protein AAF901_13290 [Bacteroidota bacterium]
MKKLFFLAFMALFLTYLLFYNSSENVDDIVQNTSMQSISNKNPHPTEVWQTVNLQSVFSKMKEQQFSFSFDKTLLKENLADESLEDFRFMLGVQDNELIIACLGILDDNTVSSVFQIGELKAHNIDFKVTPEETIDVLDIANNEIKKHVLNRDAAMRYLRQWDEAIHNSASLENKVSENGTRYKYFTMDKEAIAFLINKDEVVSLELFFGVNDNNKITTVFLGQDKNGDILLPNAQNIALDFTKPCPSDCDPDGTGCCWWICPDSWCPENISG